MADTQDHRPGEEEDEDEQLDDSSYKTIKDAVLFAIDVSATMLDRPPASDDKKAERDSPTSAALKCAYQLMQQRIISNPKDMMGILLFGTEKTDLKDGDNTFQNCYLLSDLDVPCAQDVKQLRDLIEDEAELDKVLKPAKEPPSIATVLFCANQIFTTKAPNFSSRRLFLVTDNDNPVKVKADKDTAVTRARDLYDLGCSIDLFPISRMDHGFDRSIFYDDLVYPTSPSDPDAPALPSTTTKVAKSGDGISLLKQLLSSINSKSAPRRAQFSVPFEIGPGLRIGVKGYIMMKRQEHVKSCYVWVGGEKVQIATASTTHMADDTARVVEKGELRKAYKFGGDTITFTPEEFTQIRGCFGDPIIRIVGFKPLECSPIWANTNKSTFIYPSEADYVSSTRVFSALQQKLLKDKKMGVAWFIPRRNATPVIAAVIPGEEQYDENDEQTMPPGLWLVPLPYADDLRQPPEQVNSDLRTTDELTMTLNRVVENLQLPKGVYDPSKYPNPDLQWFYQILQSMALEEELPEKPVDKTVPRYKQINRRCAEYLEEFGKEFESTFKELTRGKSKSLPTGRKRAKAPIVADDEEDDAPKKPARKKAKTDVKKEPASQPGLRGGNNSMSDAEMAELGNKGQISKQSVAVLKEFLSDRGLPAGKKKIDLLEQVQDYLHSQQL